MFTKQEASALRQQFWTNFGQYLAPIPDALGNKINWVNYKTGIRHIHFKMDVTDQAYIAIEIAHNDQEKAKIYFDHLKSVKSLFEQELGEGWNWEADITINEKEISRIYVVLKDVNIFRKSDWPMIISFLKSRIISLDKFWSAQKEVVEMLG